MFQKLLDFMNMDNWYNGKYYSPQKREEDLQELLKITDDIDMLLTLLEMPRTFENFSNLCESLMNNIDKLDQYSYLGFALPIDSFRAKLHKLMDSATFVESDDFCSDEQISDIEAQTTPDSELETIQETEPVQDPVSIQETEIIQESVVVQETGPIQESVLISAPVQDAVPSDSSPLLNSVSESELQVTSDYFINSVMSEKEHDSFTAADLDSVNEKETESIMEIVSVSDSNSIVNHDFVHEPEHAPELNIPQDSETASGPVQTDVLIKSEASKIFPNLGYKVGLTLSTDMGLVSELDTNSASSSAADKALEVLLHSEIPATHDMEQIQESQKYMSKRIIIADTDLFFIPVARDIVSGICDPIVIMRRNNIDLKHYNTVLNQLKNANILDAEGKPLLTEGELEHFLDIYKPEIFKCAHCDFDKKMFMSIGDFIYENGIDDISDYFPTDELLDYLIIMEKLDILKLDGDTYSVVCSRDGFLNICSSIPNHFYRSDLTAETFYDKERILETAYDKLFGYEFERFCASILYNEGYQNVTVTKKSSDHGVDILAEKDGISYVIQCKRYSSNIGNSAIQQAHAGKTIYKKDVAIVLTNQYFTPQAKEEADQLGVKCWDRDKLNEMIVDLSYDANQNQICELDSI